MLQELHRAHLSLSRLTKSIKESNMNTLWQQEEFMEICSKEKLMEEAVNFEKQIPVRNNQQARHNQDPERFFTGCFWNRRPNGVVIDKVKHRVFILEFKWSTDREESFLETQEAEANEQHKNIVQALRAAVPTGWKFEQINFVASNRGSVIGSDFDAKLKKLGAQEDEKNKLLADQQLSNRYARSTIE